MLPLQRFKSFISEQHLFNDADRVLLAVSGGKDSVLMAHLFNGACLNFGIAHCNFRLRGEESDADEVFVKELAERLGVPFYVTGFDTMAYAAEQKVSVQMAARELRYDWFEHIRNEFGYDCLATAHHQNDVVETVLLNLVRGTGISGLHGILPGRNGLVRPMLFLTGSEINDIVSGENMSYREDSSNSSIKYARNKLRHDVIPHLKEINPQLERTFEANSKRFAEIEEYLESQMSVLRHDLFKQQPNGSFYISIACLAELRPQKMLLFELFRPFGFSEPVLSDLALSYQKHSGKIFASQGYSLLLDREVLILSPNLSKRTGNVHVEENESAFSWNGFNFKKTVVGASAVEIKKDQKVAYADAEKLIYPLDVRSWKEGDMFYPLGMQGKKKLSDFFIGSKVPMTHKADIPLLINGNGDIIWVGGYRLDDRYKIGSQTKKVAIFELQNHGK